MEVIMRLNMAIDKFSDNIYNTVEFHQTVESIIKSITEDDHSKLRGRLLELEAELELIDFTIDHDKRRDKYFEKLKEFTDWIAKY